MITFNTEDFHLNEIVNGSGLETLQTINDYYIFGVKENQYNQDSPMRCAVGIFYKTDVHAIGNTWHKIHQFFDRNGITSTSIEDENYKTKKPNIIKIGLRKDLRDHILLSKAVIKTIIYVLEGKVSFGQKEQFKKFKGIPNFW